MPITIGSNISSLRAQRSLSKQADSLASIFQRLSSGSRINKAADDAAGLAIADALKSDTRVYSQGIRNLNDGLSYLNIADGALSQLSNVVVRIREIAEQAANGVYSTEQRKALQEEVTSLQAEYNRIVKSTEFNGQQILTGENTKTLLQGGYGTAEQLTTQIGDAALEEANDLRAGTTTRVDTSSNGTLSNDESIVNDISADGRYVVFSSTATNLVSGDTNTEPDIFVKDTHTGETKRVSTDSSGNQANSFSRDASISADGRYVTFVSNATNLDPGATGGDHVFIKDTLTGQTNLVSSNSSGSEGNGSSYVPKISADGRYVVFDSSASNLISGDLTPGMRKVYMKDTHTGDTTMISTDSSGNQGDSFSAFGDISADGRYVTFTSFSSNLVSGDTNFVTDVFLKDTLTGETKRVSTDSSGNQASSNSYGPKISADGRFVTFHSDSTNLVTGDTNGTGDVFVKDMLTGETKLVSTDSSGNQVNNVSRNANISADGRFITFESDAGNLTEGDANGISDIFLKDTHTGETRRVSTLSSGAELGSGEASRSRISADGRYVVFGDDSNDEYVYLRDLSKAGVQEIAGMVVSNQVSAQITLDLAKRYQDEITAYRAGIGTSMSRAQTFVKTLETSTENYKSAESQITNSDVAKESSNLIRSNILQQTASAVLAQANQQPALVLQLL